MWKWIQVILDLFKADKEKKEKKKKEKEKNKRPIFEGSGRFLWKPESEHAPHNLVVLTPCDYRDPGQKGKFKNEDENTKYVKQCWIFKKGGADTGEKHKKLGKRNLGITKDGKVVDTIRNPNGNRVHWKVGAPGKSYGKCWVVLFLDDGTTVDWKIPNGGDRIEI